MYSYYRIPGLNIVPSASAPALAIVPFFPAPEAPGESVTPGEPLPLEAPLYSVGQDVNVSGEFRGTVTAIYYDGIDPRYAVWLSEEDAPRWDILVAAHDLSPVDVDAADAEVEEEETAAMVQDLAARLDSSSGAWVFIDTCATTRSAFLESVLVARSILLADASTLQTWVDEHQFAESPVLSLSWDDAVRIARTSQWLPIPA